MFKASSDLSHASSHHQRQHISQVTVQQLLFTTGQGELMLPLAKWSLADLNVPPYPEDRVYRQVARQVCAQADDRQAIVLIVKERPALIDGRYKVTRIPCADLLAP